MLIVKYYIVRKFRENHRPSKAVARRLEAATGGVPKGKVFLEISLNSQENTCGEHLADYLITKHSTFLLEIKQRIPHAEKTVVFTTLEPKI